MRSESRVDSDIVLHSSVTKPSDKKYRLVPLTSAKFLSVADSCTMSHDKTNCKEQCHMNTLSACKTR